MEKLDSSSADPGQIVSRQEGGKWCKAMTWRGWPAVLPAQMIGWTDSPSAGPQQGSGAREKAWTGPDQGKERSKAKEMLGRHACGPDQSLEMSKAQEMLGIRSKKIM